MKHFREVFGKDTGDSSFGEQLFHLRQGPMSVSEFSLKFRTLSAASGWNERSLITTYRQGLNPHLWLHLSAYDDNISLEQFIQLSIRLDSSMQSCITEHQGQTYTFILCQPSTSHLPEPDQEPMQVEHARLSSFEQQRQLTQACAYTAAMRGIALTAAPYDLHVLW